MELLNIAWNNPIIRLIVMAVVMDTVFGCLRAIKEHVINSSIGIDGVIRKVSMLVSLTFLLLLDNLASINLIGFIPKELLQYFPTQYIGTSEFFGILYIAYEIMSILKNMTLCGLPVKKIWNAVNKFLRKYTDELPDED